MADFSNVESAVAAGKKILAIKEFRALTGVGLREAKNAVEWFAQHGRWPEQHVRPSAARQAPQFSSAPVLAPIERLIADGKIIHAIKDLRSITGWGLADTKGAVDHYRSHGAWSDPVAARFFGKIPTLSTSKTGGPRTRARDEIEGFLDRDQKIRAIKVFRNATGWGLRESKEAVEHFDARRTWPPEALAALGE